MHRVFISNLDLAPSRACAHVFRCYGFEIYGTVQDDDFSQPAPAEAHKIIPKPETNYTEFQQGILSCSIIIYDMSKPKEAITAFEVCAAAHNYRKFIAISTFMTWARTELPEKVADENENEIDIDELPDEKTMEPYEVFDLYKQAKYKAPQWVIDKLREIKRRERQERMDELREYGHLEELEELEEKDESDVLQPDDAAEETEEGEEKDEEEDDEEDEENRELSPEEIEEQLLKLSEYGIQEADFANRRPHPQFRDTFEAENTLVRGLQDAQNVTGAIVTPGIIYGHGETVLTELYKRIYRGTAPQAPLYYGGHQRILPFVHALDLALLVHAMCVERFPDKEAPFVFAVERQQVTARGFAESLGMRVLTDDPRREQIVATLERERRERKPTPLTKQTYRVYLANLRKPVAVPYYVQEVSKTETLLGRDTVLELTQNLPMQLGFAANDVLDGKWPLFAREGVCGNVEVAWSEFLHVWGLEPVRVFIQAGYNVSPYLGREVGEVISRYVGMPREEGTNDYVVREMIEEVGRQYVSAPSDAVPAGEQPHRVILNEVTPRSPLPVINCQNLTAEEVIEKIVLTKAIRNKGWVLINLPDDILPDYFFGRKAINNVYKFYADTGLEEPKKKKKKAEEPAEEEVEEKEAPEWLNEEVEIDEEERISLIRSHILLPYNAPRNLFSFSRLGRAKLAEEPHHKRDYMDGNVCLEHPDGFRVPQPQFIVELPQIFRYEGDNEALKTQFDKLDEVSLQIYRSNEHYNQLRVRKEHILKIKKQLIKVIAKKQEVEVADFDEENYNWAENYNLIGLDARYDLQDIKLNKKEGVADDNEEPEVDEEGNEVKKEPKPINPDDYELGLEDVGAILRRQYEYADRRLYRKQRNADRKRRIDEGAEEVSEMEEEKSDPQVDENGEPLRMVPKPRPFINTPKIYLLEEIKEPKEHDHGYLWYIELTTQNPIYLLKPAVAEKNPFTHICLQIIWFLGPPRDFPASKQERIIYYYKYKLYREVERRIEEERIMRELEARRLAEEERYAELKALRQKYMRDEERRVLELAVPLRKYISSTVLGDLIDGMIETARVRPSDPVRFLGEFLLDRSVRDLNE